MADQEERLRRRNSSKLSTYHKVEDDHGPEHEVSADFDQIPCTNMILTDKEIEEALQMSERIMEQSKSDESDPYFISLADVMIKVAATTLEVKRRIEQKHPDDHFSMTEPFASPAEERHAESMTFLDQEFRTFAECFVFVVRAYMSLTTKKVNTLSESLDYEVSEHEACEDEQIRARHKMMLRWARSETRKGWIQS